MSKLEEITKKAEKGRQKRTRRRNPGGMKWDDLVKLHKKYITCEDGARVGMGYRYCKGEKHSLGKELTV